MQQQGNHSRSHQHIDQRIVQLLQEAFQCAFFLCLLQLIRPIRFISFRRFLFGKAPVRIGFQKRTGLPDIFCFKFFRHFSLHSCPFVQVYDRTGGNMSKPYFAVCPPNTSKLMVSSFASISATSAALSAMLPAPKFSFSRSIFREPGIGRPHTTRSAPRRQERSSHAIWPSWNNGSEWPSPGRRRWPF